MSRQPQRVFDTAFKESLMLRLAAGETIAGLLKETGILRKSLYEWRDAYRKLGVAGLNQRRGPKPGGKRQGEKPAFRPASGAPPGPGATPDAGREGANGDELAQALAKMPNWKRVIGRQQVDLDFFQQALRLTDAAGTPKPIATASSRSSKP